MATPLNCYRRAGRGPGIIMDQHRPVGKRIRRFSPALFGLAAACFLLTFVQFSCGNQPVMSLTGIQLVTGTTIEKPSIIGPPQKQEVPGEPFALVALLAVLTGLAFGFARGREGLVVACASGAVG